MATSGAQLLMTRLHPCFGAEIQGVDLTRPVDDGTFARIREAFNEHSVLVFRGQPLSDELSPVRQALVRRNPVNGLAYGRSGG